MNKTNSNNNVEGNNNKNQFEPIDINENIEQYLKEGYVLVRIYHNITREDMQKYYELFELCDRYNYLNLSTPVMNVVELIKVGVD